MGYILENYDEKESKRAFIIDAENLKSFYKHGEAWVKSPGDGNNVCRCEVFCSNQNDTIVTDSIESMLDITNTKKHEIRAILIHWVSGEDSEFKLRIQRSPEYPTFLFKIRGENEELIHKKYDEITAEIKELNQWYSFLSNRIFLRIMSEKYNWILWVLSVIFLILGIWNINIQRKNKLIVLDNIRELTQKQKEVIEHETTTEGRENETLLEINRQIDENNQYLQNTQLDSYLIPSIKVVIMIFLGIAFYYIVNKMLLYLFPRGVILIGTEIKRHENLVKLRMYIYGIIAAIIATIIAGVILKKMLKE